MANGKENHRISINSSTNKSPWRSISNPADSQTSISLDRIMKEEQARGFEIANKLTDTLDSANQKVWINTICSLYNVYICLNKLYVK